MLILLIGRYKFEILYILVWSYDKSVKELLF